ncbi:sigma-70 family RNA polymerase sigma factor [Novipirellula rosea]|uniref:RNA polymerase sigma factor n=1 Tax=Novipirellula rosea TaxID=1031540 RepID=A0ABP8M892_9BACT
MLQTAPEPPDHELLDKIKCSDSEETEVAKAWKELYARHHEFLYGCLNRERANLERFGIDVEEIVCRTFQRVLRTKARSFVVGEYQSNAQSRNHVTSWLLEIARKLLIDAVRRPRSVKAAFLDPTEPDNSLAKAEYEDDVDSFADLHRRIRQQFTDKQQEIIWFFIDHYSPQTGKSHPPPELIAEFAHKLDSNPAALRKQYERLKKKLAESFEPASK